MVGPDIRSINTAALTISRIAHINPLMIFMWFPPKIKNDGGSIEEGLFRVQARLCSRRLPLRAKLRSAMLISFRVRHLH